MGSHLRVVTTNLESGEEAIVIDAWPKEEDDAHNILFFCDKRFEIEIEDHKHRIEK